VFGNGTVEFWRSKRLGKMRSNRDSVLLVRGGRCMFSRLIGIQMDLAGVPRGRNTFIIARHQKADYYADAHAQHETCKLIPAHRALPLRRKAKKQHAFRTDVVIPDKAARLIFFSGLLSRLFYIKHSSSASVRRDSPVIGREI
jgi:hypothetical protein